MPRLAFPASPSPGDTFGQWQWDGEKWLNGGIVGLVGDAPATGVFGRRENEWVKVTGTEKVLSVRMLGAQAITPGVWVQINWDTVDIDTQGGWSNATRRYTPKVAGWYLFTCLTPYITHFTMMKNGVIGTHDTNIMASRSDQSWFHSDAAVAYMNGTSDFIITQVHTPEATVTINAAWRNELAAYLMPQW